MTSITLLPAKPTEEDARLVMRWRNDPVTRRNSFHQEKKVWESFYGEFRDEYFKMKKLPPLFGLHRGERVGFLRFREYQLNDVRDGVVEVGIMISPEFRRRGFGVNLIEMGVDWAFERGVDRVVAEIKRENIASIRAFEKAGFLFYDEMIKEIVTGERVPIYRFVKEFVEKTEEGERNYLIGDRVFIVAEAGSNWKVGSEGEDFGMAKELIDTASYAGADAVKFQVFRAESVYVKDAGESDYLSKAGIKRSITDIFKDYEMPYEMIPELAKYCEEMDIKFMSTPFSVEDAREIDRYTEVHKNASYEISHIRLIEFLAKTGRPLIQSTGASTYEDIDWMVDYYFQCGGEALALLQCTAKYPAPPESLNLSVISDLIRRYGLPVGLSDHSKHPTVAPVSAVTLGATIIEKHITMDRDLPGPDHSFAIEPDELEDMVTAIRECEVGLGSGDKRIDINEEELYNFARRGVQATKDIEKGDILKEGVNVDVLRPGEKKLGMHPKHIDEMEGRKAIIDIQAGEGISVDDYE